MTIRLGCATAWSAGAVTLGVSPVSVSDAGVGSETALVVTSTVGVAPVSASPAALAAAVRGEETGIGSSEVHVGGGVNAANIQGCLDYLNQTRWDGVVSIECSGTDENTRKSVEWMRAVVKALNKKPGRK